MALPGKSGVKFPNFLCFAVLLAIRFSMEETVTTKSEKVNSLGMEDDGLEVVNERNENPTGAKMNGKDSSSNHNPNAPLTRTASRDRYGFILQKESIELTRPEKEKSQLAEVELLRTKKWLKMVKRWDYTLTHKGDKLRERIRKGIPDSVRGEVWKKLARVEDMKRLYPTAYLHETSSVSHIPELTLDEIERDINRTFPSHEFFQNGLEGQNSLRLILQSYAAYDPDVGYCQGMGFIAAMFLTYMPAEEAFYCLLSLMQRPTLPLRAMFRAGMPGTKLVLGVFGSLAEKYLPNIWQHLNQENIHHSMFATSWFMTVFTNSFPFDLVTRIFDVLWYEGWKIVYRVALALLKVPSLSLRSSSDNALVFGTRDHVQSI
jgi:TBC1 domain family member 10